MKFHGFCTINIPWNFHGTEPWYFRGDCMDCHGHSVEIPRSIPWKSTESQWKYHGSVGWKVYSVQTVEFHVGKTYETSMELGLLRSGSRFGTGVTVISGGRCARVREGRWLFKCRRLSPLFLGRLSGRHYAVAGGYWIDSSLTLSARISLFDWTGGYCVATADQHHTDTDGVSTHASATL